ncbi:hypothetical protein EON65_25825 [archaeon]|nr:MAG: hypothetical protein EON65_25825 [archaeon]
MAFIPTSTSSHLPPTPLAAHLLLTSSTSSFTPTSIYIKFVVLTDLLDYSLTDIAEALSSQRCVMFTSKEMTRLVLALFEDSPKRQALLDSIQMVSVQEATGER